MFNEFLQNHFGFFLNTYGNQSMKNNFPNLVTVLGKIIFSQCTSINALLAFM